MMCKHDAEKKIQVPKINFFFDKKSKKIPYRKWISVIFGFWIYLMGGEAEREVVSSKSPFGELEWSANLSVAPSCRPSSGWMFGCGVRGMHCLS